jgi:carbamoyl-phosphate synthase small subunit
VAPLEEQDLVRQVSEAFSDVVESQDAALAARTLRQWVGLRIVVVDYGVKRNILRSLRSRGVAVEVLPHDSDLDTILARRPDAVVLSRGCSRPST